MVFMLFTPIFTAFLRGMRERIIVFSWAAAGGISPVFSNVPRVPFTAFFLERLSPFCSSAMFSSPPSVNKSFKRASCSPVSASPALRCSGFSASAPAERVTSETVSYTHLTLPTNREV